MYSPHGSASHETHIRDMLKSQVFVDNVFAYAAKPSELGTVVDSADLEAELDSAGAAYGVPVQHIVPIIYARNLCIVAVGSLTWEEI